MSQQQRRHLYEFLASIFPSNPQIEADIEVQNTLMKRLRGIPDDRTRSVARMLRGEWEAYDAYVSSSMMNLEEDELLEELQKRLLSFSLARIEASIYDLAFVKTGDNRVLEFAAKSPKVEVGQCKFVDRILQGIQFEISDSDILRGTISGSVSIDATSINGTRIIGSIACRECVLTECLFAGNSNVVFVDCDLNNLTPSISTLPEFKLERSTVRHSPIRANNLFVVESNLDHVDAMCDEARIYDSTLDNFVLRSNLIEMEHCRVSRMTMPLWGKVKERSVIATGCTFDTLIADMPILLNGCTVQSLESRDGTVTWRGEDEDIPRGWRLIRGSRRLTLA